MRLELSRFVSAKNPEIEEFIKEKAIVFAKGKLSIKYILSNIEDGAMLGHSTLTHKSLMVSGERLSELLPLIDVGAFLHFTVKRHKKD